MKKNNKGFFLAETLIVISLVTLVLAFVYPNLSKLYDTFKLKTNYYDQIQDLQALKTLDYVYNGMIEDACEIFNNLEENNKIVLEFNDAFTDDGLSFSYFSVNNEMKLSNLYISSYMIKNTSESADNIKEDYGLNAYIKRIRLNKATGNCRLIGKFKVMVDGEEEYRYASIEHIEKDPSS